MAKLYCVKCRTKRDAQNLQPTKLKNGKDAWKGVCPVCGKDMYRIGAKKPE